MLRAVVMCISLTLLAAPTRAQSAARVGITPAEAQIQLGATTQLAVEVADVQGLYGMDITVRYDPTIVEVLDANPGTSAVEVTPGTFLDGGFAIVNLADNATGTIHYAMTQLNPAEPKSGSGTLILFTVRAKREGAASSITLEKADLANRDGVLIAATLVSGRVIVPSAAQPAPGITPIATQPPSATQPATVAPPAAPTATALPLGVTAAPSAIPATLAATTAPANGVDATPTAQNAVTAAAQPDSATPDPVAAPADSQAPQSTDALPNPQSAATLEQQPATSAATSAVQAQPATAPAVVAAAPAIRPTAQAQLQPGLLNPRLEMALVSGVCGIGFIFAAASVAAIFILLWQRQAHVNR